MLCQKYSIAASQMNVMDQETLQRLFPGLNKLLNFQRKFLIKLESIAELSPNDQSWGVPFMENVRANMHTCAPFGSPIVLLLFASTNSFTNMEQ